MTESTAVATPVETGLVKKIKKPAAAAVKKSTNSKKSAAKQGTAHPPTSEMVNAAISAVKDKKGTSIQAIKKYIAAEYLVDVDRQSPFIKRYLKTAVEKKIIVQTKGTGMSGRFKLAGKSEGTKKVKKPSAKSTGEKVAAKKSVAVKKSMKNATAKPAAKKSVDPKVAAKKTVKADKVPSKAKKSGKAPAAQTKSPKPKKVTAPKVKPIKKTA